MEEGEREGVKKEGNYTSNWKVHYNFHQENMLSGYRFFCPGTAAGAGQDFIQEVPAQPSLNLALGFHWNAIPWIWKSHSHAAVFNSKSKTMRL